MPVFIGLWLFLAVNFGHFYGFLAAVKQFSANQHDSTALSALSDTAVRLKPMILRQLPAHDGSLLTNQWTST
jgi:hypothetical protein